MKAFLARYLRVRYVLPVVVLVALAFFWFAGSGGTSGQTMVVAQGDFAKRVQVTGTVVPARDANLGFDTSGRIAGIYVRVGDRVGAGQILAETANGDLAAAVAKQQAALAQAEAKLAALKAGTRSEEVAVAESTLASERAALVTTLRGAYTSADDAVRNRADVLFTNPRTAPSLQLSAVSAALKIRLESGRKNVEDTLSAWASELTRLSAATAEEQAAVAERYLAQVSAFLSDANTAVNQAVADQETTVAELAAHATSVATARANVDAEITAVASDRAAVDSAEKSLLLKQAGATGEDIAAQEAAVQAAAADVRNAQAAFAKTRIIAPFTGVVTRVDAEVGEIASASDAEISLQSDSLFEVETFIPEVAIANVQSGNIATTSLDAYGSGVSFPARIISVDPAETVKDGVPTYKTILTFLERDPRIRSGMTADVIIETGVLPNAIIIPSGAVGRSPAGPYVSVEHEEETENRPVVVGTTPALGQVEILSGLSAGEVILLSPATP